MTAVAFKPSAEAAQSGARLLVSTLEQRLKFWELLLKERACRPAAPEGPLQSNATADVSANAVLAFTELGYELALSERASLEPFAGPRRRLGARLAELAPRVRRRRARDDPGAGWRQRAGCSAADCCDDR